MTSSVFPEKRTRSQLTLPDALLFQLPLGSPMKNAQMAAKNNDDTGPSMDTRTRVEAELTDDELLLSPRKVVPTARTSKRSASPLPEDKYFGRPESPSSGRELKRQKRDGDEDVSAPNGEGPSKNPVAAIRSSHTRSLSQPETTMKSTRARSVINSGSGTLEPLTNRDPDTSTMSGKGRAQSVPLFPSSFAPTVLRIDLRNPPASPRRPRSRSPSKERELRIVVAPSVTKLDTIVDEAVSDMHVDEEQGPKPQTPSDTLLSNTPDIPETNILHNPLEQSQPSETAEPTTTECASIPVIHQLPSTPISEKLATDMSPLSPLTPLPETPDHSKFATSAQDRYTGKAWGSNIEEEDEDPVSTSVPRALNPLLALGITNKGQSCLPRPSSSTNLATSSNISKHTSIGHPSSSTATGAKKLLAPSSLKPAVAPVKPADAFAVLMERARENGKGKGKEKAAPMKASSSSSYARSTKNPNGLTQARTEPKEKQKAVQPLQYKTSIKKQMKPKGNIQPKQKPVPIPIPVEEPVPPVAPEAEDPPSPPVPSPVNALHPSRPSPPRIMDVSMESIPEATAELSRVLEPVDVGDVATLPPAPETTPLLEIVSEPLGEYQSPISAPIDPAKIVVNDVANKPIGPKVEPRQPPPLVDIPADSTHADPLATASAMQRPSTTTGVPKVTQSKPTTTKLHISKRPPPTAAPVGRITRSASQRRNMNVPEVPKSVPRKFPVKQTFARKKSTSIEPTTGPSSHSVDEFLPQDTMASTSTLSDLPTDPTENSLATGSPMKLTSPKKRESSFARATMSTAAKKALASPAKARLKSVSPSKLTRSASMFTSRPSGISRTFTGYGGVAGKSLSTLSNALEKLHQPPPERPNTSMGFNQDDPGISLEPKSTSKDVSVAPSRSKEPAAAGSRLVQRTLINGPRSSVAGKSIFGGGAVMRGTGFKVPGSAVRPGTRLFGVGGGAFAGANRARTLQKASRKTSLPSVMASPVKGAGHGDDVMDIEDHQPEAGTSTVGAAELELPLNDQGKGKGKETPSSSSWISKASRRVSLASQALSQSLNAPPAKESPELGSMGPPATPNRKGRSASSTYPSQSATSSGGDEERSSPTTRSMKRNAAAAGTSSGGAGSSKVSATAAAANRDALKVLKDCVIFVDVRTDDGDEAGSLFVEMLEGVGARILTRVGQTCTHIVFKNGLMSTVTRYRLLRDPKPFVVGIAWVVECVEQRKQVDETKFLIDLDGMNVSGTNKRRRSMLPKLISRETDERVSSDIEGDVSMDGSQSSITMDDDLTPLEKARRRKGIITR